MPRRILVIDDDEVCRALFVEALRLAGYAVEEAEGAIMGLDMCEQLTFDLVITDLVLPDRDGTSVITELRRRYPELKVMAVSGAGCTEFVDYLKMAEMVGAHRTLAKPVSIAQLTTCVELLVGPATAV